MQTQINVTTEGIIIAGPYSAENNDVWRSLGGKFAGGAWIVPDNATSRETVAKLFGAKSDLVDVLIPSAVTGRGAIAQIGGYVLASRRGRDYAAKLADGVSLAAGRLPASGGSVKNPSVAAGPDVVYRLRCRVSFALENNLEIAGNEPATVEI